MKKILLLLFLIITGFYFTQAISLNLFSGDTLTASYWQEINNITSRINLSSNNLNIEGKLVSSGKICAGSFCLGECDEGKIWDFASSSCILLASTPETAGNSCQEIKSSGATENRNYYIDPDGEGGEAPYSVYCDMMTDGGGWNLVMNLDTNDGNVERYNSSYWTTLTSGLGTLENSLTSDYKNKFNFNLQGNKLLIKVHDEGEVKAWKSYNLNEIDKSLGYYFNKGNNVRLTNGILGESGLENINAKEPTIKQNSDLYLNTFRGLTNSDRDRISIGGTITDNYGGGLGAFYDSTLTQRPHSDGQLLNCHWAATQPCRIGTDALSGEPTRNAVSGLQYDYAIYIK